MAGCALSPPSALQVYVNMESIDDDLVASISKPAEDPNAAEVFYRVISQATGPVTVNQLFRRLKAPVLLLWGRRDPWVVPSR